MKGQKIWLVKFTATKALGNARFTYISTGPASNAAVAERRAHKDAARASLRNVVIQSVEFIGKCDW